MRGEGPRASGKDGIPMVKPGYKQTEIGVIPEDWEIRFLPFFGDVLSGGTPSTNVSDYWNGDIAWCTPSDITTTSGTTITKTEKAITELGLSKSAAILLPSESLLLCTRATIGDSKINLVPMATNQGFKNVIPRNCDTFFLYYLLQTKKKEMFEKAIGSTFLEISKSALCSIPLQYPAIPEQERIAKALTDMDELIESLEKLIAKKKAIKQGLMQDLLTGKRRLSGFTGAWKTFQFSDICSFVNGRAYRQQELLLEGKYRVLRLGNLFTNEKWYYSNLNLSEDQYCIDGDLIYAWSATFGPHIWNGEKTIFHYHIWKVKCEEHIDKLFLFQLFLYDTQRIYNEVQGGTMVHLTKEAMEKRSCYIPELDEQKEIAKILTDFDNDIESLKLRLSKANRLKQGMMQQLLTGKIRLV